MQRLRRFVLLSVAAMAALGSAAAEASHYRYGNISWTRQPGTNTVTFTVTTAWRDTAPDSVFLNYGDGTSAFVQSTNIASGPGYVVRRGTLTKTYAGSGPYRAFYSSCCRIGGIQNVNNSFNASYRSESIVDLRNGNLGCPVSSAPVIVQMIKGGINNVPLPIADPDGNSFSCRFATGSEMGTTWTIPSGLTLSTGGVLSWDTTPLTIGHLYTVGVVVTDSNGASTQLDFFIQIVDGTLNRPPSASGSVADGSNHVVAVGQTFTATVTGTDPDDDQLTLGHQGLPTGASLSPPAGTRAASPLTATFSWTPQQSDAGTAKTVSLSFRDRLNTDPTGLDTNYSFSIQVPNNQEPEADCPVPLQVECGSQNGTEVTLEGQVFDADGDPLLVTWKIDGVVVQTTNSADGDLVTLTETFPLGSSTVSITVDDGIATHTCSTTVTVVDETAPFILCAENVKAETDPGECFASGVTLPQPTASDLCHTFTLTNDAPSTFDHGTTTVTWTATDAAGNVATCTQEVTVVDREAPVIACGADVSVPVDFGFCSAVVSLTPPHVTDNCDASPVITSDAPFEFQVGSTVVTWTVTDESGNVATCGQVVTVVNTAPVANAGSDKTVECATPAGTVVTLDGTGSYDPDGHEITYSWSAAGITFDDPTSATPTATFPHGATLVTLVVEDECHDMDSANVLVVVEDTTKPVISIVESSHDALWPPNHEMVPVGLLLTASDDCEMPEFLKVACFATSSEADDSLGDGTSTGDVNGEDGFAAPVPIAMQWDAGSQRWQGFLFLRAERSGTGTGRKYDILCTVTDLSGNKTEATLCVVVPHDRKGKR